MPRIGMGRSSRQLAAAKAKAEKIFNDSANTRAAEIGVTLPANFQELAANQSVKSLGASYTGAKYVDLYLSNKTAFLQNAVKTATYDYSYSSYGRSTPDSTTEKILKNTITAAAQGGVPIESIKSAVDAGSNSFGSYINKQDDFLTQVASYAAPIAMAYFLPQVGASLGTALLQAGVVTTAATANAVGVALTSVAMQTAQGASFDDALKNATVNAIISTGAPSVATEINDIVKNPAVSYAIVSAGASALKTVAAGGSTEDMQKNILGAIAGSATTSATGSQFAGSTVGGAVTGGVAGALSGAASALGQEEATKPKGTSTDPGVKVAGGDDATALNMASISAMPEMLGKAGETASPIYSKTEEGVTFYERTISGTTPDGKPYSYTATYDPTAPVGKQVDYITGSGTTVTATAVRPNFSSAATAGGYTPTITTTPSPVITPTKTPAPVSPNKTILDLISSAQPTTPETVGSTAATPIDEPPAPPSGSAVASEQDQRMLDLISPPPAPTTEPDQTLPEVMVTATPDKETAPLVTDTKTETKEPPPVDVGKEELPPEEVETEATTPTDKYKPKLFIYGGTTPSTLSQSLGTGDTYSKSVATTGLTGSRGAGEIESKETGKKRRTVWNEESLRLKDALGL